MSKVSAVKAKFICQSILQTSYGKKITMNAVSSSTGENKDFTDVTPSGTFEMHINKGFPASDFFEPGKEYYLDISEASNPY